MHGKPDPDIFTTACDIVGVKYARAIVVEDAVSGVQVRKKGNFGFTLGFACANNLNELKEAGTDFLVEDLDEVAGIKGWNTLFVN